MRRGALVLAWVWAGLWPCLASAQTVTSEYEAQLIEAALARCGCERVESPEGQRVEAVRVDSEDIVGPQDPYPELVNFFHVRTRPHVVRREVLLRPGEPYRQLLAAETERNLRALFILSVAKVVPVRGTQGGVQVLVVTKDRWSLRLNSEFNVVGSLLQYLRLRPTEENFLGRDQRALLDFILRLDTYSLGQLYEAPRVGGSDLDVGETAALVFNRQTGKLEGSSGQVLLQRPLRNLGSTWAFELSGAWNVRRVRIFRGPQVWQLPYPSEEAPVGEVPFIYDARGASGQAAYTRSWGRAFKLNASALVGAYGRRYTPPVELGLTPDAAAWLTTNRLPRSETASYLGFQLTGFDSTHQVLYNVDAYALSEDYQLGPWFRLQARWAEPLWRGGARYWAAGAAARYRVLWNGFLARASVAAAVRRQLGEGTWVNKRAAAEAHLVSPQVWGGRWVARALVDLRDDDLNNGLVLLGGGNGLRGTPPESLSGPSYLLMNVEYRTRALEWRTVYVAGVLFYDAGSAFAAAPRLTHTVGAGLRIMLPQFNQETIRIDFGWVVAGARPDAWGDRISASYGQVTDFGSGLLTSPLE